MEKDRIVYLIKRVRAKKATADEKQELDRLWDWARNDTRLFDLMSNAEKESIREAMLENITARIAGMERRPRWRMLTALPLSLRIAASVSIIAISSFFVYWLNHENQVEYYSAFGQKIRIVLPDQSEVILNGNSHLRYAETWSDSDDREVWLDGEGFFDVTHRGKGQRFVVYTEDNMDVQVLGTRFNVKERRGKTEVMLQEGKVRLTVDRFLSSDVVTLIPGELATLADDQLLKEKVDPTMYSSWKENKFIFDQTPLSEVANMLEDTYGYNVVFEDSAIGQRKLSGQIYSENGEDIVAAIRESFGIKISVDKRAIVIHSSSD